MIFANIKDEEFTFAANRQNLAPNPLRRWVLTFELTPSEAVAFEKFFIAQKGRYKAFYWNYEGERICVRFDSDKLDQKHYPLGYREIKIPIIEVLQ
jgi:phage-related protein